MNRLIILCLCLALGSATSIEVPLLPLGLSRLHKHCEIDAKALCDDSFNIELEPTPFKNLKRLRNGREAKAYPALNYGATKDMCMWHAFVNNKIQNDVCSALLEKRMKRVEEQLSPPRGVDEVVLWDVPFSFKRSGEYSLVIYSYPSWIHALAFLVYSYGCYTITVSTGGHSPGAFVAIFGFLFLTALFVSIANPPLGLSIGIILMILSRLQNEHGEDEDESNTDGYRRMGDDETVYVAVPAVLQVV